MYSVEISGIDRIIDASQWCFRNIENNWNMNNRWPIDRCSFIFDNDKDANWFALNWV